MKTFLWLSTIALALVCVVSWGLSTVVLRSMANVQHSIALPAFTTMILQPNWWIPFFPLPWIVATGLLSFRRELSPGIVFLFAGALVLGFAVLISTVGVACVLPYISWTVSLGK